MASADLNPNAALPPTAGIMSVENNHFLNMRPRPVQDGEGTVLEIHGLDKVAIDNNVISWDTNANVAGAVRIGARCAGCATIRVSNNQISDSSASGATKYGIYVALPFERLEVADNSVILTPPTQQQADPKVPGSSIGLYVLGLEYKLEMQNIPAKPPKNKMKRLSLMSENKQAASVKVQGNRFEVGTTAAWVAGVSTCLFCDNQSLISAMSLRMAEDAVFIDALAIIANTNFVTGLNASMALTISPPVPEILPAAVLGNVVTGEILLNGNPVPTAMPLNITSAIIKF